MRLKKQQLKMQFSLSTALKRGNVIVIQINFHVTHSKFFKIILDPPFIILSSNIRKMQTKMVKTCSIIISIFHKLFIHFIFHFVYSLGS